MSRWDEPAQPTPLASFQAIREECGTDTFPPLYHVLSDATYHTLRKASLPYQSMRRRILLWLVGRKA